MPYISGIETQKQNTMLQYNLLFRQAKNDMLSFIEDEQGQDCFNLYRFKEHCQNLFESVEGGHIVCFTLMQINGYKDGDTTFKGMPILD